jgi:AraC family transcriptional regulator
MKKEPIIKDLVERQVAFVSFKGNYINNPKVFKDLFDKLTGWAYPKNLIGPDTVFLSSYQDDPKVTPPEELRLDVCMSIASDIKVEGEIQKKVLPGGKYVVSNVELASSEEYGPAWNEVIEWAKSNNYEIDMSRPSYEICLNNPEEHPDKHHIIDICLSVNRPLGSAD